MTDLSALTQHAVDAIRELLTNPDTPPSVRLRAARLVLENEPVPAPAQPEVKPAPKPQPKSILHPAPYIAPVTLGRNALCSCGSGLKFKRCCVSKNTGQAAAAA